MITTSFLEFLPQCCDADAYAGIGYQCSINFNKCYTPLRPMGASLYFSIPYRLGLPLSIFIYFNIFLILVSSILSVEYLFRTKIPDIKLNVIFKPLLIVGVFLIHYFVFGPTIYATLTDTPAALFFMIGIWLFLLYQSKRILWLILISGVFFGLSVWLRAFYLYPVVAGVFVYTLIWIFARKKDMASLALLVAIFPAMVQYMVTFNHTGELSFLESGESKKWRQFHLLSSDAGYDTHAPENNAMDVSLEERLVHRKHLPASYVFTNDKEDKFRQQVISKGGVSATTLSHESENISGGVLQMLETNNYRGILDLTYERLHFYFGSYSSSTYSNQSSDRVFSKTFFGFNAVMIILAIIYFINLTKNIGINTLVIGVMLSLVVAESLIIRPEQRFIVSFQLAVYIFACFQMMTVYCKIWGVKRYD